MILQSPELRQLAACLRSLGMRLQEYCALGNFERFVEFTLALGNPAEAILDCIRADFATLPHAHAGGTLRATFSTGLAGYPDWTSGNELTQAADKALLEAKRQGRNRIVAVPPP